MSFGPPGCIAKSSSNRNTGALTTSTGVTTGSSWTGRSRDKDRPSHRSTWSGSTLVVASSGRRSRGVESSAIGALAAPVVTFTGGAIVASVEKHGGDLVPVSKRAVALMASLSTIILSRRTAAQGRG